ncbi:uncharacterized protein LOC105226425 isoform X2 [Bactrocera dorsalis]|uniref:Uncharacterized protein LOC105226425 isoform X2 n=1 Tax=Bactrocera dorsalis TaxID=27457 RepID=A0ABM3JAQ4_BACDO|nr:uncharacterized protein LOC105226425 isoform X2 [Bactrocera dorsalis]
MDKSILNQFTSYVEQLRNTECSQKEKITYFQHIAECIMSAGLAGHINYATHINTATTVLLLFCEDLDPVVRMNAEENLNRIFRALEKTRVSRILMDLYGEIKRNGNQRSLRICLNLFAYYAPQIRERNIKWYAVRLLPCLQTIAQRKETQLCETLCEFVKNFGKYLQVGLTDSESCKLFEAFMANIGVECAVKRRCSAQNCISLIENSRNKSLMAKHGLSKAFEFLLADQQQHNVVGVLGFLRLLLPLIIHGFSTDCPDDCDDGHSTQAHAGVNKGKANNTRPTPTTKTGAGAGGAHTTQATATSTTTTTAMPINTECRQIIEIFDYCLHLLNISSASQHSIINAALEVINAVLQALDAAAGNNNSHQGNSNGNNNDILKCLQAALCNQQLQHAEYLRRRKSLKNQIFQLRNYEAAAAATVVVSTPAWQQRRGVASDFHELTGKDVECEDEGEVVLRRAPNMRFTGRSVSECVIDEDDDETHRTALSTDLVAVAHTDVDADADADAIGRAIYANGVVGVLVDVDDDDFTTLSEINEPQQLRASTAVAMAPPSYALTTTIDVDNLIDAIDATTTTATATTTEAATSSSTSTRCGTSNRNRTDIGAVQTKMQGMQPQNEHQQQQQQQQQQGYNEQQSLERQVEPQNLLTAPSQIGAVGFGGAGVGVDAGGSGSGDDKSQHLSDIDNESFNSIDFEAEITIAGMTTGGVAGTSAFGSPTKSNAELTATTTSGISADTAPAGTAAAGDNAAGNKLSSSGDTIGSFFNNLISNAASESMSKLFRPSSVVRATPTKSVPPTASDKSDVVSTASAATSTAPADSISLISTASSGNKALDSGNSAPADPQSDSVHTYTHSIASSSLGMHDDTVSTALLVDTSLHSVSEYDTERAPAQAEPMGRERRVPNANPFLSDRTLMEQSALGQLSQLTLKIGTPFEQSIVRYTARLIAARFLLAGQAGVLLHDTQIRISIKSLSLSVLAHCVRFDPEVLQLPLEITAHELLVVSKQSPALGSSAVIPTSSKSSSASGSPQSDDNVSGSSSNLGKDYEHLDAVDFIKSSSAQPTVATAAATLNDLPAELQLLEIKDDHFGKSTCDYLLHSTTELSKSADPVLMSQQMRGTPGKLATQHMQQPLSKSEIIASKTSQKQPPQCAPNQSQSSPYRVTESVEDAPPQMLPPRPPKRTKSQRKSIAAATATVTALTQIDEHFSRRPAPDAPSQQPQQVTDVLLYYNHSDPMLRGGVQQIIGGFLQAMGVKDLGASLKLNVQHLLAMLVKGLQDDIHTVVIQALNAFEKIFPYVVSKYLILPAAHHQHKQQQTHAGSAQSTAAEAAEAVDKSGRKCHANAAGQVPQQQEQQQQQQQRTNDATKSGFYTHVGSSSKSPANATAAKTCPRTLFNDNDALIAALLSDFQLQSKSNRNGSNSNNDNTNDQHTNDTATQPQTAAVAGSSSSSSSNTTDPLAQPLPLPLAALRISPKLLLSKLRLCHYNKYWLVQNKYAEVISNLNYAALHAACNDCHGHCCGTAIGCACDIGGGGGGAEVLQDVGAVADNNTVNTTLPGGGGAATAYACGEDMSYKDLDDSVCIYESQFLDELLQLIGNDDFRVRENAALCLCRFIMQNAKHKQQQQQQHSNNPTYDSSNTIENSGVAPFGFGFDVAAGSAAGAVASGDDKSLSPATYETNFNLLWDFFDYRLFSGLPLPLRNLFRATSTPTLPATTTATEVTTAAAALSLHSNGDFYGAMPQRHRAEEEKLLAKVLYRMTNKLMELEDKNAQFGIIYTLKMLLQDFNFIDYQRAWTEFNFIEICQRFSYHNYATAVDLACQNDLIDVTGKLMAGYMLASTLTVDQPERSLQLQLDQLLVHVMKILNIYYHLITQQKPQLFVKVQKSDLFANAKELALVQSVGYFGSDYIYIKLYNILRSANDSYKITINQESGRLLISLLRTCLNTLGLCIELRAHTTPTPTPAGTPTGHTPSHGRQRGHSPGSSGADTASNTGAGGGSSSSATAVFPTNATLKLIEEILQYLSKLVNYAPGECIACLRQLLKYLFGQNYGNQQRDYYATFIRPYFVVRSKGQQLQLHLQQQQQRSPQKQQKWPMHNKQQQQHAQQGSSRRGSNSSKFTQASGDHQQAMTMLHAINSAAATTLASTAAAGGVLRSMATTSDGSTSALKGAAGDGLSSPTMTTSTVRHNEPNVIGAQTQATYANRGQALIDSGHARGLVSVAAVAACGNDHNQPHLSATEYYRLMGELFASGLNLQAAKSERAGDCVKHIKLFEPLVIYCLMLFLKSNARVQAPILELLSQLLELNVTYSVLDSKNVIFDQILNNLDLIENGIVRNGPVIIPPMIKFLIQLTHKSDRKLITIPKIISITNNLLANNAVLDCAVLALKSLSYEIFFMPPVGGSAALNTLADYRAPFQSPVTRSPVQQRRHAAEESAAAAAAAEALLANSRELDTQKEVVLGMLEKFVNATELQHVVALLLLRERCAQQMDGGAFARRMEGGDASAVERQKSSCILESTRLQDPGVVYALICRAMCDGRLGVHNWRDFYTLESCFKNYSKYVLADSKNFLALLQLLLMEGVESFSALAHATIILANVILKTEEIYLVNHIKLCLKNHPAVEEQERQRAHKQRMQQQQQQQQRAALWLLDGPSTSSAAARAAATALSATAADAGAGAASSAGISEINYFAKVLCEKLEHCFDAVAGAGAGGGIDNSPPCVDTAYCQLVCRFVAALHEVCCRSRHKDALQSVFRLVLAESALLDKYCNFLTLDQWRKSTDADGHVGAGAGYDGDEASVVVYECCRTVSLGQALQLQLEVLKLLSAMKLLDPVVMLQLLKQQKQNALQQLQQQQQYAYQMATNKERLKWYDNMQRTLLGEICQQNPYARDWSTQQVRQLLDLGGATFLNFLITENFELISDLCEVAAAQATHQAADGLDALWLNALLQHGSALNKHSIRALPPLLLRLCNASRTTVTGCNLQMALLSLQLLQRLHARHNNARALQVRLERLARRLVFSCSAASLQRQQLVPQLTELAGDRLTAIGSNNSSTTFWQQLLLDTQECKPAAQPLASLAKEQHQQPQPQQQQLQQRIIDEKWLLSQLIKFSAQSEYGAQQLSRILLEIQSEQKLYKIFNSSEFAVARVLRHAIASSMQAMLAAFRNNCIQHNPHIHYMQPNPLVRVTLAVLMTRISEEIAAPGNRSGDLHIPITATLGGGVTTEAVSTSSETQAHVASDDGFYLCASVATLLEHVKKVEDTALLYIESRFIDKFVREQLLRHEHVATLLGFLNWCCLQAQQLLQRQEEQKCQQQQFTLALLQCIAALLQQRFIWTELNQMEKPSAAQTTTATADGSAATAASNSNTAGSLLSLPQRNLLLCRVLDVLVLAARQSLQHTIFYKHYKQQAMLVDGSGSADGVATIDSEQQNIFNTLSAAAAATALEGVLQTKDSEAEVNDVAVGRLLQAYAPQAVFMAKLIETRAAETTSVMAHLSAAYLTGCAGNGVCSLGSAGGALSGGGSGGLGMTSGATGAVGVGATGGVRAEFDNGGNAGGTQIPMHLLSMIGVAVLRTHQFYAYAVTPFEIIQQQQRELRIEQLSPAKRAGQPSQTTSSAAATAAASSGKLPTIPVESLSDVDVLRKFVKRLSIFGFTTRQQFEEYFMTFLLLINKVYDENMVDEQEQFQIRSTCLEAILELLITYKTFPIVGNKLSHFHHTTRWIRINCDSISLKKLHKVQLLVSEANIFYHPNLERQLRADCEARANYSSFACRLRDSVIGTHQFRVNQYDLNFMWQQMEAYAQYTANSSAPDAELPSASEIGASTAQRAKRGTGGGGARDSEDVATKNYRYFTAQSGVDFKSSTQLIFDVLMQIIEHNHILVLPNLVKFTEICESRDQIKWIKDKALKLQETIPMDDTISHQHLIYLLCKTQAMLIPTIGELQQLCQLIGNYLKSSHIFIRNATLAGLLCLLECCSKTNTTIGRLSDELALLRDLIVGYINRHGIIDVSAMQCSDTHTKLVWTLNYCLIEWTSKFVPQCHLLSNTVIAAGNFLRKTNNEDVYLCVLHGLERMVVISNTSNSGMSTSSGASAAGSAVGSPAVGIVTPMLRNKIEKLALELVKLENERFSVPALQLLLTCMYVGSAKQLENTELSNGIVQDEPEIIAQQTDKVDILLHCIKSSTRDAAWIYGQVLCQIIRDLVPPNEILTKVIKEFLAINQPHCDVIAMIVYQVFRCAIDSTFLQVLQDWLICSLPTFLALPEQKAVWCLSVIFLSASINLHLIKLFPVLLSAGAAAAATAASTTGGDGGAGVAGAGGGTFGGVSNLDASTAAGLTLGAGDGGVGAGAVGGAVGEFPKLGQHEIALFVTAAVDFHAKLSAEQRLRFRDAFEKCAQRQTVYAQLLQSL